MLTGISNDDEVFARFRCHGDSLLVPPFQKFRPGTKLEFSRGASWAGINWENDKILDMGYKYKLSPFECLYVVLNNSDRQECTNPWGGET